MLDIEQREIGNEDLNESISSRTSSRTVNVELIEYSIISKYFDEDNENIQLINLPSPESIQKLINSKLIQNLIIYDMEKYKLLFKSIPEEEENNNKEDENSLFDEKTYLDLNKISSIQDIKMLSIILVFLGGINSLNDIYSIFPNETPQNPSEECFIDKNSNYLNYVYNFVRYIRRQQISFPFSDLNLLFKSLSEIGFIIPIDNKNIL